MVTSILVRSILAVALAQFVLTATPALAQTGTGAGKIVCWKDKSGKVVGCGDSVPPEYQSSATKELDQRGVTRKTTESAEEVAKRQAREKEFTAQKAQDEKRALEQRRQDSALLNSYSTAAEIDQRRDRDLQPINQQISQMQAALKIAPEGDKAKYEQGIAGKEKEKEEFIQKYATQKKRFLELKGEFRSTAPATAAAPAPAPAPAKK